MEIACAAPARGPRGCLSSSNALPPHRHGDRVRRACTWSARLPRSGFLLRPAPPRRDPGRSLLRCRLPGRGRGDRCAVPTGEPRGLRRFAPARWGAPAPSAALSEEDPLAGAPRGDENSLGRMPRIGKHPTRVKRYTGGWQCDVSEGYTHRQMRDRPAPRTLLLLVAGCAVYEAPLPPMHPANPRAAIGRTAGAPASLRPGVVTYGDAQRPVDADDPDAPDPHAGHHAPAADEHR
jgi:hypothetical protein